MQVNYDAVGVMASLTATLFRAIKSILSEAILQGEQKLDPITTLQYMSCYSIPILVVGVVVQGETRIVQDAEATRTMPLILLLTSAMLAFALNLSNFLVVKYTSAVTLQVLGNLKIVCALFLSLFIFGNELSTMAAIGAAVTIR
jgi:drug/metabolite transporter (DMT)-like permease